MEVPQKLKIELPYDPAVPLLGIYLTNETLTQKDKHLHVHSSTVYSSQDVETT